MNNNQERNYLILLYKRTFSVYFLLTQLDFSYSLYFHSYCYKTVPVIDEVDASVEDSVVVVEESDVDTNDFIVEDENYIL